MSIRNLSLTARLPIALERQEIANTANLGDLGGAVHIPANFEEAGMGFSKCPSEEWAAREGAKRAWISIFVAHGGSVVPLEGTLERDDALLFAYTNLEGSSARHLAIAGRDAEGRVHWYHPAYQSPDERPSSIAIDERAADRELAEAVRAEHAPGSLEICALFTERPLSIPELDRSLEAGEPWPEGADCRKVTVR